MGKDVKVLIVGLPLFAQRLKKQLKEFYPSGKFICLDTYYSKKDKLKFLWFIRRVDVVFSINGSLETSGVFDLALKLNKKLILNWVGTDVLKAQKSFREKTYRQDYIEKAIHYCEVDWIKEELEEFGIDAEIVNFASFDKKFELKKIENSRLTVLSYISDKRADFYGINSFIGLAKKFPEVNFKIVGTKAENYLPLPENLKALGWVENMDQIYNESHICFRYPEHDGLSSFILESLARGKQVIYKYPFDFCKGCSNEEELANVMTQFVSVYNDGGDLINYEGEKFIQENFNSKIILSDLIERFKK